MKVAPSHRIRLNVDANAMPLNAMEAIRGSPSPCKVLAMMPTQAAETARRVHDSTPVNFDDILTWINVHRYWEDWGYGLQ